MYNAEKHLRHCLDTILDQSLSDFELLCVDDGSTDRTLDILSEYAERDARVQVLRQHNAGAGAARNLGLDAASGEYLSFLDADDFFEPTMLELAYEQCVAVSADVAVYKSTFFDEGTGASAPADGLLQTGLVPAKATFSREDIPDHILVFAAPAPWNKLFRSEFIASQGLRFQETKRANDLFFTRMALAKAERITVVDEYLVNYRVGVTSSLQATVDEAPTEFFQALRAVRAGLAEAGLLQQLDRSFVNDAVSACLYNLNRMQTVSAFLELYEFLRTVGLDELGITQYHKDYFFVERHYSACAAIISTPPEHYLFDKLSSTRKGLSNTRIRLKESKSTLVEARSKLKSVRGSRSYRIGRGVVRLSSAGRRLFGAAGGGVAADA
jgi:glycosyltransferase involved in cell wall biosynthesis